MLLESVILQVTTQLHITGKCSIFGKKKKKIKNELSFKNIFLRMSLEQPPLYDQYPLIFHQKKDVGHGVISKC